MKHLLFMPTLEKVKIWKEKNFPENSPMTPVRKNFMGRDDESS